MKSAIFFIVFAAIGYVLFNYCTNGQKHIDGTDIDWWEKWVTGIVIGFIGICIGKLLSDSDRDHGSGGGDYSDCTGGAGGI